MEKLTEMVKASTEETKQRLDIMEIAMKDMAHVVAGNQQQETEGTTLFWITGRGRDFG